MVNPRQAEPTLQTFATQARDWTARKTVAGLFFDWTRAFQVIQTLKDAGFTGDQISVAMRDRSEQGRLVEESGTKAAEDAVTGAVGGSLLGGLVGFLVSVGVVAVPGMGPVVAGGLLASVLGAGIGAMAGGLVGALVGLEIPETEARHFEAGVRTGHILVAVQAGTRAKEAAEILERYGADIGPTERAGVSESPGSITLI